MGDETRDKTINKAEVVVEEMGEWETLTLLEVKYWNVKRSQGLPENGVASDY